MADRDLIGLLDSLHAALVPPTRLAARLPPAGDLQFERTLSRKLARSLDHEQHRVLHLAQRVLDWAASPQAPNAAAAAVAAVDVVDADLIREGVYNPVTERIEPLLEHADDAVDRHLGTGKHRRATGVGALGAKSPLELAARDQERAANRLAAHRLPPRLLHDASIEKPQKRFTARTKVPIPHVDDHPDGVPLWTPILRQKVNAGLARRDASASTNTTATTTAAGGGEAAGEDWLATEVYEPKSTYTQTTSTVPPAYTRYLHPYAAELATLTPPARFLEKPTPPPPAPAAAESFAKTPFEWVGDAAALARMVDEIRVVGEQHPGGKDLAIDLEHHDYRSWSGMTCLIQLSTRKKDYVIDALEPSVRDGLEALNEFLTDPEWVKVLHGANSDVVWLQRDFGLYIVGLFDTYHATKILGHSQHSLASLLAMYTDFEADKRYQLADWRIRPLPTEMLHYARSDTHYLLSIYDHLRLALHEKTLAASGDNDTGATLSSLEEVYRRSIAVSSITFSLPPFDHETGHFDSGFLLPLAKHGVLKAYSTALAIPTLPLKTGWGPSELKFEVLRSVIRWREQTARDEDESARYVLSLQGALQLAEVAGGIRDANDVMRVLGGTRGGVSEVVRRRKDELALLVRETVERVRGDAESETGKDVDMVDNHATNSAAAAAANSNAQLGLPAPEPAVRPIEGLWSTAAAAAAVGDSVASTSSLPVTKVVSVSVAAASAFFGSGAAEEATTTQKKSTKSGPVVPVAASSSFFGPSQQLLPAPGNAAKNYKSNNKGKSRARSGGNEVSSVVERAEAVKRVHDSLVLGGGLGQSLQPKPIPTEAAAATGGTSLRTGSAALPDTDSAPASTEPEMPPSAAALTGDHTYVPLSGRIPKERAAPLTALGVTSTSHVAPRPKDSDVIVVSSLKDKPKKRRRQGSEAEAPVLSPGGAAGEKKPKAKKVKATLDGAAAAASTSTTPKKEKKQSKAKDAAPIVPYDYSTSTSILDADPATSAAALADKKERMRQAKADKLAGAGADGKKKKKGFEIDLSDFRRAPRVANAPKKANVSRSFAK
ncbi:hypothetical protein JCM3774_006640 [Rhodotorula dairenensis]